MAIRASSDNQSLDHPAVEVARPVAPVHDFAELWAHREALRHACHRMVGNAATAEDLVQDTYVRALSSNARFEGHPSMIPWLNTVARRRTIDELRARRRLSVLASPPEPPSFASDDPAQQVVNSELVDRVRTALAELSPRERQLLLRQVSHGVSLAELAAEESTSVASVRSVLTRARHKLRASLERGGALGSLPLSLPLRRALGSFRVRMHRRAAQAERSLPGVTAASWQMSHLVAVVLAVVASWAGGLVPTPWPAPDVTTLAAQVRAAAEAGPTRLVARASDGAGSAGYTVDTEVRAASPGETERGPGSTIDTVTPFIPSTTLPTDGAAQPENAQLDSFTASSDGSVVLAAARPNSLTALGAVYRTTDGGRTWDRLPANNYTGGRLFVSPSFPTDPRVLAVGGGQLQRSGDGGRNFVTVAPTRGGGVLSPDFAVGDRRLLLAGPPLASYEVDGAAPVPYGAVAPPVDGADIDIGPSWSTTEEVLVGGTASEGTSLRVAALYSCTPAGCQQRALFPNVLGNIRILTSRTTPGLVTVWGGSRLHTSVDGGLTFTTRQVPTGLTVNAVHEDAAGALYIAGIRTKAAAPIFVSHDQGATWLPMGQGSMVDKGVWALVTLPNGRLLASVPSRGVACSVDGGATWSARCPA